MPMYDYRCRDCDTEFEIMKKIAERLEADCPNCEAVGDMVIINNGILDPKMGLDPGFPTAHAGWRNKAERRGRGKDMTSANKEAGEDVQRDAHAVRQALGENPITVN